MVRGILERVLGADSIINALYDRVADKQYTRELLSHLRT